MFLLFWLLSFTVQAETLNLVAPQTSRLKNPVDVEFALEGDELVARFQVSARHINAKPNLAPGEYTHRYDVVEVFVSVTGAMPYYEFQLSPLGQTFEGTKFDHNEDVRIEPLGLNAAVARVPGGWTGEMRIPLRALGWNGDVDKIVGNAFAIQGKRPNRSYWSLYSPPARKPNFHQPQFFRRLL